MRLLAAVGLLVFVLVLVWGCSTLDAPMPFGRLQRPKDVNLDAPLPRTVHGAVLHVAGQTQAKAFVHASVDSSDLPVAQADAKGRFDVALDLGNLGTHLVRIDVSYRSAGDVPDESTFAPVTRTTDAIQPPRLLAVTPTTERDTFQVVMATAPGLTIVAHGATIVRPPDDRGTSQGRPVIVIRDDPGDAPLTLQATDGTGGVSEPTGPIDLAVLARGGVTQDPADRTEVTATYRIGHAGITRVQTVVLDPHRAELGDLVEGRQDVFRFLDTVAGRNGLTSPRIGGCLVSQTGSAQPSIEIGDQATVTLVDEFPDFIANTNGLADRPVVTLCFPQGLPILGDVGHLVVRVTDYAVMATTPQPTTVATERSDSGLVEQVYGWDRVPVGGSIRLTLAVDVPTSLGLLPKARVGDLVTDPILASLTSGVFYAIVQGAGLLLLLWLTASRATREHLGATQRRAVSHILICGVALAFLPAVAEITNTFGYDAFDWVRARLSLTPVFADLPAAPSVLGGWLLTMILGLGGAFIGWGFRRDRPLLSGVGTAVALAAVLWFTITVFGRVVLAVTENRGVPSEDVPLLSAWIVGSALLAGVLVFTLWRFEALRLRPRSATPAASIAIVGWGAAAAIILAFPAGRQVPAQGSVGGPVTLFDTVIRSFIPLLAYGYALVGVAAVVLLVRNSWYRTRWEQIVLASVATSKAAGTSPGSRTNSEGSPPESVEVLLRRLGRVIFAGYVIGTAGVFAVLPIPFLIAFPLFDRVLLRRPSDARHLARDAGSIRLKRTDLLKARMPQGDSKDASSPIEAVPSVVVGSSLATAPDLTEPPTQPGAPTPGQAPMPAAWVRNVAALGPRWPIWNDIVLALQIGAVLAAGLVILYLTQYPFASVTTADPYYLQRLGLNVAAFVGSWVILGFFFGLMYANLRGESGLRKGLWLGAMILALTLPFQLLSTLASGLPLWTITIRVLQVLAFTVILGLTFDVWLLHRHGRLTNARAFVGQVGGVSGSGLLWTGLLFIGGSVIGTLGTIVTGQLTVMLTRILTPFLPVPPP